MEFNTRQDIEAPIAFVFEEVTNFGSFERQALRRGADVQRRDALEQPGIGVGWDITFSFRGKDRHISAEITEFDRPNGYRVQSVASTIDADVVVDLLPLSKGRTRLSITTKLSAKNLGAKLMLQSLKVAKSTLNSRLSNRVDKFAREVAEKHARRKAGS